MNEPIYISYIVENFLDEQFAKIYDLSEIEKIAKPYKLVSWEIVKNKAIIKRLENNKKNYGCYCLTIG